MNDFLFSVGDLRRFGVDCFLRCNVPREDAEWTIDVLLKAELQGKSTHGMSRLSAYVDAIRRNKINSHPKIEVQSTTSVTAMVNGDNGLGPVVAKVAIEEAIDRARQHGLSAVSVRRANHAGALGIYVQRVADEGLIGLAFTNAQPAIPPWGGRKAYFGTNPIAMSAGRGNKQIVIDLATSIVARGNIILAAKEGKPIPEGWALDSDGLPTTDALRALAGSVLPMAGVKGYSLALLVEILSSVLSGAAVGDEVGTIYDDNDRAADTGMFFLALNPDVFGGLEVFEERLSQMEDAIHEVPVSPGNDYVFLPGERRRNMEAKLGQIGVRFSVKATDEFTSLAHLLDVQPPRPS